MCGCIEDMPQVSRADCTTREDNLEYHNFSKCVSNDLRKRYDAVFPNGELSNLSACDYGMLVSSLALVGMKLGAKR